ncbi:MAG TPA: transcription antitermination factor NusB [Polyangiaceae bacterium]
MRNKAAVAAPPTARTVAAHVLERVDRDRAYAAATLAAELERHPQLDGRDRALCTELVYGVLRARPALLSRLSGWAPRGIDVGDSAVCAHLLVASYQLLCLDRVPAFAAVDAAVGVIGEIRDSKVAGFANAVLRKLASRGERLALTDAVLEGAPAWLFRSLQNSVGREHALALLGALPDAAGRTIPPACVRLVAGSETPTWLIDAEPGRVVSQARILHGQGDLRARPGYAEGAFSIQEEGSQCVALALGVKPGDRVLDACAGRGQKAALFAERLPERGELWAADLHPSKLDTLAREFGRLHLPLPHRSAVDWTVGSASLPRTFDRILVDAPCTGAGTLRRRPEILWRLEERDPARLGGLARRILRAVAELALPGTRIVFAVCSVLPEETVEVVEGTSDLLEPVAFDAPELEQLVGPDETVLRLLPSVHGTDGYFVASLRRRA